MKWVEEWWQCWLWSRLERAGKRTLREYSGQLREIHPIVQNRNEAEIFVFFHSDADLKKTMDAEFGDVFEREFRSNLPWGPPWFKKSLRLTLVFDSHENVLKHFEGSYFLRLR